MTPSSYLIKFDRKLSEILVDIDHDFSSWDDVALTNLYPLQEYLVESKDDFRMAVVEDNESYKYVRIVENIMLTFNNYILWAGKHQDIIKDGDEKDEKRILVEVEKPPCQSYSAEVYRQLSGGFRDCRNIA